MRRGLVFRGDACATLLKDASANAAVEFALISPLLILLVVCTLDFEYAYYVKLRLVLAANAAAQYAFENGQTLTASGVPSFITNVQAIASSTAALSVAPTVSVLVNNATDGSNYSNYYCLNGSPATWSSTSQTALPCTNGTISGRFVTIQLSSSTGLLFNPDPIIGSIISLSDFAIVRVQ